MKKSEEGGKREREGARGERRGEKGERRRGNWGLRKKTLNSR